MPVATVSESDWAKGIGLSVLASILGAASKLAIRKSWLLQRTILARQDHEANDTQDYALQTLSDELPPGSSSILSFRPATLIPSFELPLLWPAYCLRFGGMMGMTIFNPLCCVFAMSYASPSILAPFSGLTLVWIIVFSDSMIQEKASPRQVAAAALIIAGEIIVSFFGDHTNDANVTVNDVRNSYFYPPFLIFLVALFLWLAFMTRWMRCGSPTLKRFAWGVAGGSVTGLQCFLKDALIVLKSTNGKTGSHHLPWWFFLLIVLAIASAFSGLLSLTACMKRFDVTFSSAMFVGSFIVSTSIMSVAHYATFANLQSVWSYVMYPIGLLVLMSGVVLLAYEPSKQDSVDGDRASDDILASLQAPLMANLVPISDAIEEDEL